MKVKLIILLWDKYYLILNVGLENQVQLFIDDKPVNLPPIQAIVFLNIDSWGAGIKPWNMGQGIFFYLSNIKSEGKLNFLLNYF